MASRNNLKLSNEALRQLRQLPAVRQELVRRAEKIAEIASENGRVQGYKVTDLVLEQPRGAASVLAYGEAYRHNRKHNAIVKAFTQVRD